jgi:hypothetical protein
MNRISRCIQVVAGLGFCVAMVGHASTAHAGFGTTCQGVTASDRPLLIYQNNASVFDASTTTDANVVCSELFGANNIWSAQVTFLNATTASMPCQMLFYNSSGFFTGATEQFQLPGTVFDAAVTSFPIDPGAPPAGVFAATSFTLNCKIPKATPTGGGRVHHQLQRDQLGRKCLVCNQERSILGHDAFMRCGSPGEHADEARVRRW